MKKILTLFIAAMMAISIFAFSACGGNSGNAKGSIDGKYTEISTADQYQALAEKVENVKPAAEDAETAGGVLKSNADLKLTVGGKSVTLTGSEVLNLIVDLTKIDSDNELEAIKGAAVNAKLSAKADRGFGTALTGLADKLIAMDVDEGEEDENADENSMIKGIMALIDDFKIDVDANAYVKENKVYADAKITGIPDGIKALVPEGFVNFDDLANGVKCSLTATEFEMIFDIISGMVGGMMGISNYNAVAPTGISNYEAEESDSILPSFEEINAYLAMAGAKLSAEITDKATKIKLATTADTKTIVTTLINSKLPAEAQAAISNLAFSKLDVEIYLAIDANGVITAAAAKIDVAVSATVLDTAVSISLNGASDASLAIPEIKYPSFEGYNSPFGGQEAA